MFIGDSGGNIYVRKLTNGLLIKNIYHNKNKQSITGIYAYKKGILDGITVFATNDEGDIMIFTRDSSQEFVFSRLINIKRDFQLIGNMASLGFQEKRNNLLIGTSAN